MGRPRKERPDGCLVFSKTLEAIRMLPDEDAGKAVKALASFFLEGVEPDELELAPGIVFGLLKSDALASFDKFEATCERNKAIADKREAMRRCTTGDHASPPDTNQTESNPNLNETNLNERVKGAHTHFSPPSVDEVRVFCKEQGINVSPERFVDYNAARGWAGITDWRSLIKSWERTEKNGTQRFSGKHQGNDGQSWGDLYDIK